MKATLRLIIFMLIVGCFIAAPRQACADTKGIVVEIMTQVCNIAGLPGCDSLGAAIDCLSNPDIDSTACLNTLTQGDDATSETILKISNLYTAVNNGEYWDAIAIVGGWVGDQAPCIVLSIMLPSIGNELCGILGELIKLAELAVKAVIELFKALGTALKVVYCFLFGCDSGSSSTPPEVMAYADNYQARICVGASAMASIGGLKLTNEYLPWISTMAKGMLDCSISWTGEYTNTDGNPETYTQTEYYTCNASTSPPACWDANGSPVNWATNYNCQRRYDDGAIGRAEKTYKSVVEGKWHDDIIFRVIPKLNEDRKNFKTGKIQDAKSAAAKSDKPPQAIVDFCKNEFIHKMGDYDTFFNQCVQGLPAQQSNPRYGSSYEQIDRWIAMVNKKSQAAGGTGQVAGLPQTNAQWCYAEFLKGNKDGFSPFFFDYAKKWCPLVGDAKLLCMTQENLTSCSALTGYFDKQSKCIMNPIVELENRCPVGPNGKRQCQSCNNYSYCQQNIDLSNRYNSKSESCVFVPAAQIMEKCPKEAGTHKMLCTSKENYAYCAANITTANTCTSLQGDCGWTQAAANQALAEAAQIFQNCDSSCSQTQSTGNNKPAKLTCSRAVQVQACQSQMATPLVSCLKGQDDPAYTALIGKVQTALPQLNTPQSKKPQKLSPSAQSQQHAQAAAPLESGFAISSQDPLMVYTGSENDCVRIQNESPQRNFGFTAPSTKPGFDYQCIPGTMSLSGGACGLSTPKIVKWIKPPPPKISEKKLKELAQKAKNTRAVKDAAQWAVESHGPGPIEKESRLDSRVLDMRGIDQKTVVNAQNITTQKDVSSAGVQGQGGVAPQTSPAPSASPTAPSPLPDLTATGQVSVAGMAAVWNGMVTIDASRAQSRNNGICEYAVAYGVQNTGKSTAGAFRTSLSNSAIPGSRTRAWPALLAGSNKMETDVLSFKTGVNILQLTLDDMGQVQESNESNNLFRLTVNVMGNCSTTATTPVPAAPPGFGAPPKLPPAKKGK